MGYRIEKKEELAPGIYSIEVFAPRIAGKARPGQFVMVMVDEKGERIPLTISDWCGSRIQLVFEVVGRTTSKLAALNEGQSIFSVSGPLGNPSDIRKYGGTAIVGGGVGTASCYPIAKALKGSGNRVISIIGARSKKFLIFEEKMRAVSDEIVVTTDDGTYGKKGLVTDALEDVLGRERIDRVWAIGPAPMMKGVSELTRERGVETVVSLNAIMVDGTGMCGSCRVTVGGKTKFTCVDGPEFMAHEVDWDEFLSRLSRYSAQEKISAKLGGHVPGGGK